MSAGKHSLGQRILLLLGVAVNVAFLLINLHPERPHLAAHGRVKVLLRADPPRAKWIKENELDEFAAEHDVRIDVVTAQTFEEVLSILKAESAKPTGLLLASIDSDIAEELRRDKAVRAIEEGAHPQRLDETVADYLPDAMARGRSSDGKVWFLPRRAEVDIAVYLTPAVEDVYLHWEQDRAAIGAALAAANGVGLPKGYTFEKRPDAWDSYDLFVAGWYWAHHPAPWSDAPTELAPRLALRTGDNEDAVGDLLGSFYRHGLTDGDVRRLDAAPVIDALQWDALLRKHHLLAAACEDPKGIDSDGVNDLLKARKIAWAPINQEDSLWLHGGSQRTAEAGISDPNQLAWATMPSGASLELTDGKPARAGKSFSFLKVQLWAVPVHAASPQLAFELAAFLTRSGLQQRETEAQGLLPIRRDLRADYPILFRLAWMQRILDASYHQIAAGSSPLPPEVGADELDAAYVKLRAGVVYGRPVTAPVTLPAVKAAVRDALHGK